MISVETFDAIQQRRAETTASQYEAMRVDGLDPQFLTDNTRCHELLRLADRVGHTLLNYGNGGVKVPSGAEWYNALYTSPGPSVELTDEQERKLSVFVLRNQPFDMGEPLITRTVLTEKVEPDDEMINETPFTVLWAGPSGPFAVHSPLMYDKDNSEAWQETVREVFTDLQ